MGGHSGVNKTQNAISKRYYWPSITADIKSWIKQCDKCQRNNPLKPVVRELHPIKVSEPWEMIGIDLMGPWKETKFGFKYLFTATDFFTKWVEAFPLRKKSALEVEQCLLKLFYRYGATKSVLHDNGREFVNKVNEDLCRLWGVEERFTATYSPQTNGLDERTNQTLKRTIQKMVNDNQDDWDQFIDSTLFSTRVKIQMTTKFSPFYLVYHREAKVPTQITMPQPVIPLSCACRIVAETLDSVYFLLMAVVGGHKLTGKSFEGLKPGCEITDEVINAYMALLREQNHSVDIIDCFIVDQIINHQATSTHIMRNMTFNDFTLLLCPVNTGGHWEIAFAFPQYKKIVYINLLGERHSNIAKFIRGWRSLAYKRSLEGLDSGKGHQKWTISTVPHTLQSDSVSCGIFIMKFAELMTRSEELFFDIRSINNIRKDIACNLLAGTSDVQDVCRKCTMHYTLNDNWVQCESCHWWQHFQCTTIQKTFNEVNQEDYRFICDICSFK